MKEYRIAALGWGVDFKLKPYTDEKTAAEDFKAGQCDGVVLTGTRYVAFKSLPEPLRRWVQSCYDHLRSGRLSRKSKAGETSEERGLRDGGRVRRWGCLSLS